MVIRDTPLPLVRGCEFPHSYLESAAPGDQELREARNNEVRPHRLQRVGQHKPLDSRDKSFLQYAQDMNVPIMFIMDIPKGAGTKSYQRYKYYRYATTLNDIISLSVANRPKHQSISEAKGLAKADMLWDFSHGFLKSVALH